MPTRLPERLAAATLLALSQGASGQVSDPGYESRPDVYLGDVVPASLIRSGNHRVLDEVTVRGNALRFHVESDFGTYRIESLPMLALRVREIRTLAQAIDHFNRENEPLAAELRGQLSVGADSFVDILTSPLSTSGRLAGQLADNVGQTLDELGRFPDPEGDGGGVPDVYSSLIPGDPIVASHKRAAASQLGLDVFSSNPRVQELLDTIARARASGNRSAGVMTVSLPRDEGPIAAGGRIEKAVRTEVTRRTMIELYARNLDALLAMDVPEDAAHAFLANPALSPRHKTSIVEHLAFLDGARNRRALVEVATGARDEQAALAYTRMGRALAVHHESIAPIAELKAAGHVLLAESADRALVALLPFDIVYWTPEAETTFTGLARFAREHGYREHAVVLDGVLTPMAREQLRARGFTARERFLLPKPEG